MSRTAKMNMIMHGDGHGGVHHNDGLLNVNGIFENRFDIILTNPPFGSRVEKSLKITEADKYTDGVRIAKYRLRYGSQYDEALKQVNSNLNKPLLSLYDTGALSTLTEVLFIERCLNLLKPGGRMGIVLPEGVLNNTNLQKVRDYVESRAKIVLITSIPQDVFIASGATVKPSLLFFKKFTEEESHCYANAVRKAKEEVRERYKTDLDNLDAKLIGKLSKELKKEAQIEKKKLMTIIENDARSLIKQLFDYQIPIAEVEKAGISTTGAEIENELIPLEKQFTKYRKSTQLWTNILNSINYDIIDNKIYRVPISNGVVGEPEGFYGE